MIYSLKGKIIKKAKDWVALQVGDTGYKVYTNPEQCKIHQEINFFIFENIKEDQYDLYGFSSEEEQSIFTSLITVNGVGPKAALNIITNLEPTKIIQAIESSNIALFQSVPGIGAKVASKIVVELKSKITSLANFDTSTTLIDALNSLGFKQSEIMQALKNIPSEITQDNDKIKWAIKNIRKT